MRAGRHVGCCSSSPLLLTTRYAHRVDGTAVVRYLAFKKQSYAPSWFCAEGTNPRTLRGCGFQLQLQRGSDSYVSVTSSRCYKYLTAASPAQNAGVGLVGSLSQNSAPETLRCPLLQVCADQASAVVTRGDAACVWSAAVVLRVVVVLRALSEPQKTKQKDKLSSRRPPVPTIMINSKEQYKLVRAVY